MSGKCAFSEYLSGIGSFLSGLAACTAVWIAKDPVTNYLNSISVKQTVIVNICEGSKQVDDLVQKSNNLAEFNTYLDKIPSELSKKIGEPMGLIIAPEFREAMQTQVKSAESVEAKKQILKNYWEKSLSKETKSAVDLKLNDGK